MSDQEHHNNDIYYNTAVPPGRVVQLSVMVEKPDTGILSAMSKMNRFHAMSQNTTRQAHRILHWLEDNNLLPYVHRIGPGMAFNVLFMDVIEMGVEPIMRSQNRIPGVIGISPVGDFGVELEDSSS